MIYTLKWSMVFPHQTTPRLDTQGTRDYTSQKLNLLSLQTHLVIETRV